MQRFLLVTASSLLLGTSVVAQCSNSFGANWSSPLVQGVFEPRGTGNRAMLVQNTLPYPIEICSAAMRLSHDMGTVFGQRVEVTYEFWSAPLLGSTYVPGAPNSTVTSRQPIPWYVTPPASGPVVPASFVSRPVLQPGERRFLVATFYVPVVTLGGNGIRTSLTHGSEQIESFYWKDGQWNRSLPSGYCFELGMRPFVRATSVSIGAACGKANAPCSTTPFETLNWNGGMLGSVESSLRWAFRVDDSVGQPARQICGLELPLATTLPAAQTLPVFVYDESGSSPGQLLGQTTVSVPPGATATPQYVSFPAPVPIGAGKNYWIAFEPSFPLRMPVRQFGTTVTHRTSGNGGASWSGPSSSLSWSVRTYVTTGAAALMDLQSTVPVVGSTSTVTLANATPSAPLIYLLGSSNPDVDLTLIGAPGCRLLSSGQVSVPGVASASGGFTTALQIPNDLTLLGVAYYEQIAAVDAAANALGLAFSNGRHAKIGAF